MKGMPNLRDLAHPGGENPSDPTIWPIDAHVSAPRVADLRKVNAHFSPHLARSTGHPTLLLAFQPALAPA